MIRAKHARTIRHGISIGRGRIFTIQHHPEWESMALGYPWKSDTLGEQAAYRTVRKWREKGQMT